MIATSQDALDAVDRAWPLICGETLQVLGSELHYQAMIYHCLRAAGGVPVTQLGMNVRQFIPAVQSELFKSFAASKAEGFRTGFEPVPDVVIFSEGVEGDWRRRRHEHTIKHMLAVIEVKASERAGKSLSLDEVVGDIRKLAAHREEVRILGGDFHPIMLVVDSARDAKERMRPESLVVAKDVAVCNAVQWRYVSPVQCEVL
jgi:hypothetical protein